MNQNPYLSIAIEAARAGEEVIRHYYTSKLKISVKQDRTPVTVADIETEEKIREVILGVSNGAVGRASTRSLTR